MADYEKLWASEKFRKDKCRTLFHADVFLSIYSNQSSEEALSFRVWDALEGVEYARIEQSYTFVDRESKGSPTAPEVLSATNEIVQRVELPAGWYWISFNVTQADMGSVKSFTSKFGIFGELLAFLWQRKSLPGCSMLQPTSDLSLRLL